MDLIFRWLIARGVKEKAGSEKESSEMVKVEVKVVPGEEE